MKKNKKEKNRYNRKFQIFLNQIYINQNKIKINKKKKIILLIIII